MPAHKRNPVKKPTPQKVQKLVANKLIENTEKIQDYPKPVRIATVKALHNQQMSIRRISRVLSMSPQTVSAYIDEDIDNEWLRYSDAVNKILTERRDTLKILAVNAIENKLQDTSKIPLFQLSGLYKVLHDVERVLPHQANHTLIQTINVHPSLNRPITIDNTDNQR